ncbi:MAG TPA: energy transducer TonB [Rhizomicrobium sp.]|nr:energy transducer TonB [Rhizomicrobium sp.]
MPPLAAASRVGALVATLAAHLLVIAALIAGLRQAQMTRQQETMVNFVPHERKPEEAPPPSLPELIRPAAATAPIPQIITATPPPAAAAPMMLPSPPSADPQASNAVPSWETGLLMQLQQARRFPPGARRKGVVLLRFTMDRDGNVLAAKIEKGSGDESLDREALAALQRAQPLPKPPAEITGNPLDLIVPVDFF